MTVFRRIAAECRADRVFAPMILGLGSWSALSPVLLALNVLDPLPAP
ncbi:hypothetical protein [Methylobacterium sp. Leaf456]|nr:hypothetical protein [Methylobacterium sp. Leaf456]